MTKLFVTRRLLWIIVAATASACQCGRTAAIARLPDGGSASNDAGLPVDAGPLPDAGDGGGGTDAGDGGGLDSGALVDGGSANDAGGSADGGGGSDAGTAVDAGLTDAGATIDAGNVPDGGGDAGLDGGPGLDGGLADAGIVADAGPCTPQNGGCAASASCCGGLVCSVVGGASGRYCEPNSATGCGLNSTLCNGVCVTTLTDPVNCGGCGLRCAANQVCTGGSCQGAASCPQGLTACNGSCVDLQSSSANCGACGSPCPAGQGCAAGSCVQSVALSDGGPSCAGGGPPVRVGDAGICVGTLAQVTFRWALCACGDVGPGDVLKTDAFNSAFGPYADGGPGGSVGANGGFQSGSLFDIGGTAWFGGDAGMGFGSSGNRVGADLLINGPLANGGDLQVVGDAWINGSASGPTAIGGTLHVPTVGSVGAGVQADGGVVVGAVFVPPPCDCAAGQLIDVAAIVLDGQAHNDNASIGLDPDALNSAGAGYAGAQRLDLPCGRYYLSAIHAGSAVTIAVHGRTAIFVGGNVDMGSPFSVTIDPQAEVDFFIGGTINSGANVSFGSTEVPAQSRVYVAGNAMSLGGSSIVIAGNFYLPYASFSNGNPMDLYGSMFSGSYGGGPVTIHYDTAVLSSGQECGADAGTPCTSCRDCSNQACIAGSCGACQSNLDCCSPLICSRTVGRCVPPG